MVGWRVRGTPEEWPKRVDGGLDGTLEPEDEAGRVAPEHERTTACLLAADRHMIGIARHAAMPPRVDPYAALKSHHSTGQSLDLSFPQCRPAYALDRLQ